MPCVLPDWPGFTIEYRHRGTPYTITVDRQQPGAVPQLTVDGELQKVGGNVVELRADGGTHTVHVAWLAASDEQATAAMPTHLTNNRAGPGAA